MALSPVPFFYYSAYCDSTLFKSYLILGIGLGLLAFIIVSIADTIKYNQYKKLRKMLTPLIGIVSLVGLIKLLIDDNLYDNYGDTYDLMPGLYLSSAGALCFFCGFAFYGLRYILSDLDFPNAAVLVNTTSVEAVTKSYTSLDYLASSLYTWEHWFVTKLGLCPFHARPTDKYLLT